MKKPILILLFLSVFVTRIFAGELVSDRTVAVYDFTGDAQARNYGTKITALVTSDLAEDTNLVMLDRSDLNKVLNEQAFGISGMVSFDAAAKIGKITGAKILISGQVVLLNDGRMVAIADIVGTETGRLFAVKNEGSVKNIVEISSELSGKISKAIAEHSDRLLVEDKETSEARIKRILNGISGTNRPAVSVNFYHLEGPSNPSFTANTELGIILQKAGFQVVDGKSDRKPEVEVSGMVDSDGDKGTVTGGLHTQHAIIELKAQERRSGRILMIDRQESVAVDASQIGAQRSAQALAVDELSARLLPVLAK